jgi:hypothetical protein
MTFCRANEGRIGRRMQIRTERESAVVATREEETSVVQAYDSVKSADSGEEPSASTIQ